MKKGSASQGNGICGRCEAAIAETQMVCDCGAPTVFMSFEDRNRFEVERYRAMRAALEDEQKSA